MATPLFDMRLRAMRRDRAFRRGPALFLHERAFDDCLERLELIHRTFDSALLIGCPNSSWLDRLGKLTNKVDALDPGPLFASVVGGDPIVEDQWQAPAAAYGLCLAVGTLDTVNDLPRALRSVRHSLRPNGLLLGAFAGGNSLPQLRSAMRVADALMGAAAPHAHPRIEPSAVGPLLSAAGYAMPVVDVDRVQLSYKTFQSIVDDLRSMGSTNILCDRPRRPLTRRAVAAATEAFRKAGNGSRTTEVIEIVHFSGWVPQG